MSGIAVDGNDDVYVVNDNGDVKLISPSGVMTNIATLYDSQMDARNKSQIIFDTHLRGMALDHSGNIFVSAASKSSIFKVTTGGVVSILAGTSSASKK